MSERSAHVVRTGEYAVPLPEGWSDHTAVTLVAPPSPEGYVANLVVTRQALCDNMGLGGFADGHVSLLQDHADELAVVATEHVAIDGERGLVRTVRFRVGAQPAVVQLQAFCVRDGHGYAIIGSAAEDGFAAAEPHFRAALDGFRFTASGGEAAAA